MDETTDAVKACLRIVQFFARESCGKCSPCREGTSWEEQVLQRILDGHGRPSDLDLLLDIGDNISPGPYPVAAFPDQGLDAVPFPPRQDSSPVVVFEWQNSRPCQSRRGLSTRTGAAAVVSFRWAYLFSNRAAATSSRLQARTYCVTGWDHGLRGAQCGSA